MFDLDEALTNNIICQKRTSKYKQFVIIKSNLIIKGPYSKEKLELLLNRSLILKSWNAPFLLHPNSDIINSNNGHFITFPNLAVEYPIESILHTESFSNYKYKVLIRNTLLKLGDEILKYDWIGQYLPDIAYTLILLYILGIGDVGLYNILIDINKKHVYIIDFEENRSNDKDINDEFFMFSKRPAKAKADLWLKYVKPNYQYIIGKLNALILPNNKFNEYINNVINHLKKFCISTDLLNIGKMIFKGMFGGSTTFSGYSIDIVKSGLQKYIRRNIVLKALYCGFELYRMIEIDKGISIQTNCYNRLAVIACEDIGPANLSLCIKVVELVLNKNRDINILATIIQLMSISEKTRIMSHLNRTYCTTEGKIYARNIGFPVDDFVETDLIIHEQYWKSGDPEEIKYLAEMFLYRLYQKNFMVFDWLGRYKDATKNIKVMPRKRRTDPMVVIWDMLQSLLPYKVHEILSKAYFKMTEKTPFLMTAIIVALYSIPYIELDITESVKIWTDHPTLNQLMKGEYNFQTDDFIIDKHTKQGKIKGASRDTFVKEGAYVTPQSELYYIKIFEDIYINS